MKGVVSGNIEAYDEQEIENRIKKLKN